MIYIFGSVDNNHVSFLNTWEKRMNNLVAGFSDTLDRLVNPNLISIRRNENMERYIDEYLKELVKRFKPGEVKYLRYRPVDKHTIESVSSRKQGKGTELVIFTNDTYSRKFAFDFELNFQGDVRKHTMTINIPLICDDGVSYLIKGNKYCIPFQMVDSVFYNRSSSKNKSDEICLKTALNDIKMRRAKIQLKDVDGVLYTTNEYLIELNRSVSKIPMLLFYFAEFGFFRTLEFFCLNKPAIGVNILTDLPPEDSWMRKKFLFFKYGSLYLSVRKDTFVGSHIVREMIACVLTTKKKNITAETIKEVRYWIQTLGTVIYTSNTYNGGIGLLKTFKTSLDDHTKWLIREFVGVKTINDIYTAVRWMFLRYIPLVKQDLSLVNQRLRLTEFIIWPLQQKLLRKTNSYENRRGNYKNIKTLQDVFKIDDNIIIDSIIGKSSDGNALNIGKYNNAVNDLSLNNYITKGTRVGPGSSTSMKTKYVPEEAKRIIESMIGRIDIVSCSSNKPGATFNIVPGCQINTTNMGFV